MPSRLPVTRRLPLFLLLLLAVQLLGLLSELNQAPDSEELYNATVGQELLQGHLAQLFDLQYRHFCGGCTVAGLAVAPLYAFFSPRLIYYKLLPVLWLGLMCWVGWRTLERAVGPRAALAWGLLLLLPPYPWLRLSYLAYGNHYESCLYLLLAISQVLAIRAAQDKGSRPPGPRFLALGFWTAFGAYTCLSAAFAVPVLLLASLPSSLRRLRSFLFLCLGCAAGATPWGLYALATGINPLTTPVYEPGDLLPSLEALPRNLASLLAPRQIEGILGCPWLTSGRVLAWATASCLAIACWLQLRGVRASRRPTSSPFRWQRAWRLPLGSDASPTSQSDQSTAVTILLTWLTLSFLLVILLNRSFSLDHPAVGWPEAIGLRYLAPGYLLGMLWLATGVAYLARSLPQHGPRLAVLLLTPALLSGLLARANLFVEAPLHPGLLARQGTDYPYFRPQATFALPRASHWECQAQAPDSQRFHAWARGYWEGTDAWESRHKLPTQATQPAVRTSGPSHDPQLAREQARAYWQGVALVWRNAQISAERPVPEVVLEALAAAGHLPQDRQTWFLEEVLRAPDWLDGWMKTSGEAEAFVSRHLAPLRGRAPELACLAVAHVLGEVTAAQVGPPPGRPESLKSLAEQLVLLPQTLTSAPRWLPALPPIPGGLPPAEARSWLEGLGETLGDRWAPSGQLAVKPPGLTSQEQALFEAAWQHGARRSMIP